MTRIILKYPKSEARNAVRGIGGLAAAVALGFGAQEAIRTGTELVNGPPKAAIEEVVEVPQYFLQSRYIESDHNQFDFLEYLRVNDIQSKPFAVKPTIIAGSHPDIYDEEVEVDVVEKLGPYSTQEEAESVAKTIANSGVMSKFKVKKVSDGLEELVGEVERDYPERGSFEDYKFEIREALAVAKRVLIEKRFYDDVLQQGYDLERLSDAQIQAESSYDKDAESPVGAKGLKQLTQDAIEQVRELWPDIPWSDEQILNEPVPNLTVGDLYFFGYLIPKYNGNVKRALEAFNMGEGALRRRNNVPYPETRDYRRKITERALAPLDK